MRVQQGRAGGLEEKILERRAGRENLEPQLRERQGGVVVDGVDAVFVERQQDAAVADAPGVVVPFPARLKKAFLPAPHDEEEPESDMTMKRETIIKNNILTPKRNNKRQKNWFCAVFRHDNDKRGKNESKATF